MSSVYLRLQTQDFTTQPDVIPQLFENMGVESVDGYQYNFTFENREIDVYVSGTGAFTRQLRIDVKIADLTDGSEYIYDADQLRILKPLSDKIGEWVQRVFPKVEFQKSVIVFR